MLHRRGNGPAVLTTDAAPSIRHPRRPRCLRAGGPRLFSVFSVFPVTSRYRDD